MYKKIIISLAIVLGIMANSCAQDKKSEIIHITNAQFKKMIFDYQANKDWKYVGTKPCIIDFYADWCGPCRMMAPRLEEMAQKYKGKLIVYKVNTDNERELSGALGIQSLPTLLFVPIKGQPQASMGLIPTETLEKAINEVLLIK